VRALSNIDKKPAAIIATVALHALAQFFFIDSSGKVGTHLADLLESFRSILAPDNLCRCPGSKETHLVFVAPRAGWHRGTVGAFLASIFSVRYRNEKCRSASHSYTGMVVAFLVIFEIPNNPLTWTLAGLEK
jgi:hypothetical protein